MFTSKEYLSDELGVDPEIARFFVDRKVPQNNMYWKGRLLYVARGTGYLFIPLLVDLMYKAGIPKGVLLETAYVQQMEQILDLAARYEYKEKTFEEHIAEIDALVLPGARQQWLVENLRVYFRQEVLHPAAGLGIDNPPLNRGDALLYWFTALEAPKETIEQLIAAWYALVPAFLLLDDLVDLKEDQENNDENSVARYGYNSSGVREAITVLEGMFETLGRLNAPLAVHLNDILVSSLRKPYFQHILKN
ncbi:hypothetical protein [Flavihumibacter petaseus]|uniref:Uncharacterized protein n=1 Tax=Flavihumibacter petaseus NBRC 106054 TaxID=1220578 RepID=A0A0E9N6X1_9BACT|nr:hypothetical protein [Flavihumibacter petaseus]GAO45697.1 hypothetical protein FPE01S_08_00170 [Flavihumibacter petaseus NBRC 106054]